MGLSTQFQQGLAGVGAYTLCLLGLLLGPSGVLGGIFGPLLALINLALIFVGGIQLIMVNPTCALLDDAQGPNVVSSFVWFCVFATLASVALGPAQIAVQLNTVDDLHDMQLCDWNAWSDTGGGVYFVDGSLQVPKIKLPGYAAVALPAMINVTHCEWFSLSWRPCQLLVRPLLRCSQETARCKEVCAWGIVSEDRSFSGSGSGCRSGDGSLCGIGLSLMRLTQGKCAGPDARDRYCQRANEELAATLDTLANNLSLTTSWASIEDMSDLRTAPLLWMVDPEDVRAYWNSFLWIFLWLSILYLPAPLLVAYIVVRCHVEEWPVLASLRGRRSHDEYIAVD